MHVWTIEEDLPSGDREPESRMVGVWTRKADAIRWFADQNIPTEPGQYKVDDGATTFVDTYVEAYGVDNHGLRITDETGSVWFLLRHEVHRKV